jgi:hypothetical protein
MYTKAKLEKAVAAFEVRSAYEMPASGAQTYVMGTTTATFV